MHLPLPNRCKCEYQRMNFRQLRTFVTVAEAGGFARAAGRLNLTEPAASRQIMALEADLGVSLFDRVGRGIQLTFQGEDLLRRSRQLLQDAASLGERARVLKGGQTGTFRVGAPTQVIENLLAPFVTRYHRDHPGVKVHFVEAAAARLQSHLNNGNVHLGIMPSGFDPFNGTFLYPIYVTAALPRRHPWARQPMLELAELAEQPLLVLGREFGIRSWFEAACDVAHVRPRMVFESWPRTRSSPWRAKDTRLRSFPLMSKRGRKRFVSSRWRIEAYRSADGR